MSAEGCNFEGSEFFIFSTWGDPHEWYEGEYVVKCFKDHYKRTKTVYPGCGNTIPSFTTVNALINILKTLKKHIILTIFIQDTLLLNMIKEQGKRAEEIESLWQDGKKVKQRDEEEVKREDLEKFIFNYICDTKPYKEISGIFQGREKDIYVILPGIASFRKASYLYSWRGDECYEYIRGGMLTHALKKLAQAIDETIGVIVDTSHGVNYFAIALKDVIPLACALYVVKKGLSNAGKIQLHLYHYNVQPIIAPKREDKVSTALEIVSFEEMGFHRKEQESFGPHFEIIREHIENIFSKRTFEDVVNFLEKRVPWLGGNEQNSDKNKKNSWELIGASTLLFVRGVLPWALRIAGDLELGFEDVLNKFEEKLNKINIKFESSKRKPGEGVICTATYDWGNAVALHAEAATLVLLAAILKEGAESALSRDLGDEARVIDEAEKAIKNCEAQNKDAGEKALQLLNKLKGGCVSVPASRLSELAGIIYPKPFSVIVQAEIDEQFKKYFEVPCKESCCNENVKILPENDIVVKSGDFEVYLPYYMDKPAQERHFHAHAGLVRGTIFAIVRRRNEYVLLLGPYEPVLRALREWHGR
jgi:CRISPR-associated protein Csx1